jgi:hypothetical protein
MKKSGLVTCCNECPSFTSIGTERETSNVCRYLNRKHSVQDKKLKTSNKLFGKMKFSKLIIIVGLFYQLFSVQSKRVNKFKAKQLKGNLISILWKPNQKQVLAKKIFRF